MPLKHCCDHLQERKREREGEEKKKKRRRRGCERWKQSRIKNLFATFFGRGPRTSHALKSYLERIKLFFFSPSHRFSDVIPRFSRVRRSESSSVNPLVVGKRVLKSSGAPSASQNAGWILPRAAAGTLRASLQTSWSGCKRRLSWVNTPLKLQKKTKQRAQKTRDKLKAMFLPN